jgi:carboxymethylenebutenolidase
VDEIRGALEAAGGGHEVVVYPGADHGFFCDQRDAFQQDAASDAWERVKALFRDQLAS